MLERKKYRAVHMILAIVWSPNNRVAGYISYPKITIVHVLYSSFLSRSASGNCKRGWISNKMKPFRPEVCDFKKDFVKLCFSPCRSRVYTIALHFLDDIVEDITRFGNVSLLDVSAYDQSKSYIKRAYRGSTRRRTTGMQEKMMFTERPRNVNGLNLLLK